MYFHQAFLECGLFSGNGKDDFSKFLIHNPGDLYCRAIPRVVENLFRSHEHEAMVVTNTSMTCSYQTSKRNLALLVRIMISRGTYDEKVLTTELNHMSMKALRRDYGNQKPRTSLCEEMKENMKEHEKLLNHETKYIHIFNKLGDLLQQGYIDKQIGIHPEDDIQSAFDPQKVSPIVKRIETKEGPKHTSYIFCANNILSPPFLARTIQGINSS